MKPANLRYGTLDDILAYVNPGYGTDVPVRLKRQSAGHANKGLYVAVLLVLSVLGSSIRAPRWHKYYFLDFADGDTFNVGV
jgi:hypothetical protein